MVDKVHEKKATLEAAVGKIEPAAVKNDEKEAVDEVCVSFSRRNLLLFFCAACTINTWLVRLSQLREQLLPPLSLSRIFLLSFSWKPNFFFSFSLNLPANILSLRNIRGERDREMMERP